jgi:hypothetical protein
MDEELKYIFNLLESYISTLKCEIKTLKSERDYCNALLSLIKERNGEIFR